MKSGTNTQKRPRGRTPQRKTSPQKSSDGNGTRVRGNAGQIMERYLALARDASSSGDRVMAENYFQHADHYYRLMNASQGGTSRGRGRTVRTPADPDPMEARLEELPAAESENEGGNAAPPEDPPVMAAGETMGAPQ